VNKRIRPYTYVTEIRLKQESPDKLVTWSTVLRQVQYLDRIARYVLPVNCLSLYFAVRSVVALKKDFRLHPLFETNVSSTDRRPHSTCTQILT
jgi:hypothetical protein